MKQDTYFININGDKNCFISKCVFIIFTIFILGEVYKLILRGLADSQTFTIKKIISTRYDLNQNNEYDAFAPKLNFPKQEYKFDLKNTVHINNNMKANKPPPDELTKSMKYQQNTPSFKITNNKNNKPNGIQTVSVNQKYKDGNNIIPVNYQDNQNIYPNLYNANFNMNVIILYGNIFEKK